MGDWNITVRGTGSHHNGDRLPSDANRMAARFAEQLTGAGHTVRSASFSDDFAITASRSPTCELSESQGQRAWCTTIETEPVHIAAAAGRRVYEAFCASRAEQNTHYQDGDWVKQQKTSCIVRNGNASMPSWDGLTEDDRGMWIAAAKAVLG